VDTGGTSLLRGFRNFLSDVRHNNAMPSLVDKTAFKVGKNLGTTPGAVVFRNEVLEIIQYTPTTKEVRQRPLVVAFAQINKYYLFDLSPHNSFVKYSLDQGIPVFVISWRNPTKKQSGWDLDTYVEALKEAIDVISDITGSADCNLSGTCAGGITYAVLAAHLAALGEKKINTITFEVAMLDFNVAGTFLGLFADRKTLNLARNISRVQGVLEGGQLGGMFSMMRPNDLIWNYLMGNKPPAFDILYWNCDSTRLSAGLHSQFLDMFMKNPLPTPGKMKSCGTPIDLSKVTCDCYYVTGITDHITPWEVGYRSSRLLGGDTTFMLAKGGHVQTVVSPPDYKKAAFYLGKNGSKNDAATPEKWLENATEQQGSWWEHWKEWILTRSGETVPAPAALGNDRYQPIADAPGTYVIE